MGTFLRAFTFGHVRQVDSVAASLLVALAGRAPLLPGADSVAFLDLDDTMRETHGYAKQGAGYGYTRVKGLNALIATVSTPVTEALGTARACRAGGPDRDGLVLARADSAFYCHDVIAAVRRGGVRFSITARMDAAVTKAIATIADDAWTPIRYPTRSGTTKASAGSPTPRSPRPPSPRSPPAASPIS